MARIVFWNVNKKMLNESICKLALSTNADVIILVENGEPRYSTLAALQREASNKFFTPDPQEHDRFQCYCAKRDYDMSEVHSGLRFSVRSLRLGSLRLLVALLHGVDIRNNDSENRIVFASSLSDELRFVIEQQGTNRMIIIGDFNMNPYERGMNSASGLNAMMSRECVKAQTRRHLAKEYDFYYNPMWSLFGDRPNGPPGTTYNTSNQGAYGWSMLDQVIINYSAIDFFDSVEILTMAGDRSLANKRGRPDKINASDHFPILLYLKEAAHV